MFTWILILGGCVWIALVLLILHDVAKNDDRGSFFSTLVGRVVTRAGGLQKVTSPGVSQATVSKPSAKLRAKAETSYSSPKPVRHEAQPLIEQSSAAPAPRKWWSGDTRVSKTTEELELMIGEAVKALPGCDAFVSVVVERATPKSRLDANWELRGIRFGGMDRQTARKALTPIVQRMQQKFRLA